MLRPWFDTDSQPTANCGTAFVRRARSWPGSCEVCRTWSASACCASCTTLFSGERPRCQRCGEPWVESPEGAASLRPICASCQQSTPVFTGARVAFDYAFPWDGLIQQLKFAGRTDLARPLGDALAESVLRNHNATADSGAGAPADIVVPMPLTRARLAERGYNQALLLAKRVARQVKVPLEPSMLHRPIETPHQADLSRAQRITNLKGVFMVDPAARPRLQDRRVALVDDVMTTGSTANEASRELLRGGAREVVVWAVARTAAR